RAAEVAARLEAGMVYINGASEDPEAPFGGYKMSGNGREWGELAFGEFLETKAIIHSALPAASLKCANAKNQSSAARREFIRLALTPGHLPKYENEPRM